MILGIESSCDESALALFCPDQGIIGEWVHSQISQHSQYGGVVPDLAVRQHLKNFTPLLDLMFEKMGSTEKISEIVVTCGPGLIGCLGIGLSIAKTLGELFEVKVLGVNHLRGHAYSPFMQFPAREVPWRELLPHLGLLVSGGNTLLFELEKDGKIKVIGRTIDDAAGEALDKGAKLLGIAYPGGAELEKCALLGNPSAFSFPRAFQSGNNYDFSFSGLKTSLLYQLNKMSIEEIDISHNDICASYQEAALDQLIQKTKKVMSGNYFKSFGLSGGVANNLSLRQRFSHLCDQNNVRFLAASTNHTGDNASMIAHAAYHDRSGLWSNETGGLNFNPSLTIDEIE